MIDEQPPKVREADAQFRAALNEALLDHAERARRRGRSERQWLASTRRSGAGRLAAQLLPHVAAVVWSGMFDDDDDDDFE